MAAANLSELYTEYLVAPIVAGLGKLAGTPKDTATDEKAYRQVATDPIWNNLPLPLRMIGSDKLRWDAFLLEARNMVFALSPDARLTSRPAATARLTALAGRLPQEPLEPAKNAAAPGPLAAPVAAGGASIPL